MAWFLFVFLPFLLQFQGILGNLEGEIMKISELNPGMDPEKLKIFDCPEGHDCQVGALNREPNCVERRRIHGLGVNGTDKYIVVAGEMGRSVQLECHYCNERDDPIPKVWYYYEKFLASKRFKPVPLHLEYPPGSRKFVVDEEDHRLTIRNFTEPDGALYFCQGLDDNSPKFNYLVDAVGNSGELEEPKRGSFEEYLKYHAENVGPLNKKLQDEYKNDLKNWFAVKPNVHNYNVSHAWSQFGRCHSCGREHGVRMRTGTCQLNIPTLTGQSNGRRGRSAAVEFGFKFSCHSTMLKRFLTSKLRKSVNSIRDFIEEFPCDAPCTLAGLGAASTAELLAPAQGNGEPPTVSTVIGTLGESVTLLCADDAVADVVWLKDNKILVLPDTPDRTKSKIAYTRNRGGLHFPALNESQGGNYTCIFDDLVKMIFKLETRQPVTDPPIPEDWIWMNLGIFSIVSFIIWIFLVVIITRVTWRTQRGYQPLSSAEESFLQSKRALMEARDDQGRSAVDA